MVMCGSLLLFGQTPESNKDLAPQTFAFSFDGGSYLGVETQPVNKENFSRYGLREVRGVAVGKVLENSPAALAGLQAGDVIVRFNGEEVTSSGKLTRLISEVDPDHQAKVTVFRNGREQELTATLAKRPAPQLSDGNFEFHSRMPMGQTVMPDLKGLQQLKDLPEFKNFTPGEPHVFTFPDGGEGKLFTWRSGEGRQIGVGITPLTEQLAEHFGVERGVMINEVRENSPAARAGLKAGDIIVDVDGKPVKADTDLIRAINGKKEGEVQLTVVRGGSRKTFAVTPEASKESGFRYNTDGENGPAPAARIPAAPGLVSPPLRLMPAAPLFTRPGRII